MISTTYAKRQRRALEAAVAAAKPTGVEVEMAKIEALSVDPDVKRAIIRAFISGRALAVQTRRETGQRREAPTSTGWGLFRSWKGQCALEGVRAMPTGHVIPLGPWVQYPFGFLASDRYCWW